jgi:hypothetical protein
MEERKGKINLEGMVGKEKVIFITHQSPHLDELVAIWLIERFGNEKFLKIFAPEIPRVIPLGIEGGSFDEHPTIEKGRKEGECTASLVAKALEIETDPALEEILEYLKSRDLQGGSHPFEIATLVSLLTRNPKIPLAKVAELVSLIMSAKYEEQLLFLTSTKDEFFKKAEIEEIIGPQGERLKMVTIVSDNELMNKFARSKLGGEAAIVIQQNSKGNVQIFTNKKYGLKLYDVVKIIRYTEQWRKGAIVTTDWDRLAAEGIITGAEEWYFHEAGQMLLNGSLTHPDVPPTNLTIENIKEAVRIGINPTAFEPTRAEACLKGKCLSTRKFQCPWYPWGLSRCRKIRFERIKRQPSNYSSRQLKQKK